MNSIQYQEAEVSAAQALKSRTFWHIGLGTAFQFLALIAVTVHVMPYLSSVGIIRSTASFVAMSVPLISIFGRLSSGWLVDRFNKKQIATVFFSLTSLGLLIFSYVSSDLLWLIVLFVIIFGIGWGGNATIRVALVRNYFGRSKFGSIYGLTMGLIAVGGIIGPFFAGWVYDNLGSYRVAWLIFTALAFAGMIIISTTPPLNMKQQTS